MNQGSRLSRFGERHRGAVVRKALDEGLARLWLRPGIRRLARPFLSVRQPLQWVFMTGCYNSGTTILREILGAHPDIATLPREGVRFTDAFPDLHAGGWARMWHRNAEAADLAAQDPALLARQAARDWGPWWRRNASVFLEKSITHAAWMPFLQQAFPGARFIFVIRNGFCAAEGILRRARPGPGAARILGRETYLPAEAAQQWKAANDVYIRDRSHLAQLHEIRYEAFAANPAETLREALDFLGLSDSALTDLGAGQVAMGARVFRIADQNAESLARLDATARDQISAVIEPMMHRLGYASSGAEA